MIASLYLPFPISNNELTRNATGRVGGRYKTGRYKTWLRAADALFLAQKRDITPVHGPYRLNIVLDCARRVTATGKRRKIDCGNFEKAVQDFLTGAGLTRDDSDCEEVIIRWGWPDREGCEVTLRPTDHVALPIPRPLATEAAA